MRTTILVLTLLVGMTIRSYGSTSYSLPTASPPLDLNGNPVSASVILSLSQVGATEVLTVVIDDNTVNQKSDGENVTGVELNINSSQITGDTLVSSSGAAIDVPSQSSVTHLGVESLTHWTATTSLSQLTLTTIGGGTPIDGIIGIPNGSGVYSNADGSLTGSNKWPFAQETATFTIDLTGTNISMSSITGAEIGFGTLGTNYINATVITNIATPEPGTFWLLGISGVLIALGSQRKRLAPAPRKNNSRER
jgi:hypothetical protein